MRIGQNVVFNVKKKKTVDFVGGLVEDHDWSAINYDSSSDFFNQFSALIRFSHVRLVSQCFVGVLK